MNENNKRGKRQSIYMTERVKGMLTSICASTGENASQVVTALVMKEYYKLNLDDKKGD